MRLKELIKRFEFTRDVRAQITLDALMRLNPELNAVHLKADADGLYPTTADIKVKTWTTNPANVKQWLGFQVEIAHTTDLDTNTQVTGDGYRLGDGTDEFWHDGAGWVINTTNWNTEAEVANNISTFPATSRMLQVIVNLTTTDATATPYLSVIKVLYSSDIEFQDDLLYRSLVPLLRQEIRPIADYPIELSADSDTIDLADAYALETPYNIAGIDSVFNHTDDPGHDTDIFQSYNSGTKQITLTGAVTAGKVVWIRFTYEPEVAITTSQDYNEISKVPALILSDIALMRTVELPQPDAVINKSTGVGKKVQPPMQGDIEITMRAMTDKGRDQQRLADEIKRFFANNPFIVSKGLDEKYRLWLIDEYTMTTQPSASEVHSGRLRFRIAQALFFQKSTVDAYAVTNFEINSTRVTN